MGVSSVFDKTKCIEMNADGKVSLKFPWVPDNIQDTNSIPKGDMPGDKVMIDPNHIKKAQLIFPILLELLIPILNENLYHRAVVAVCGGSGIGKTEIASLLSYYLEEINLGSYTLSGDNYPYRIPKYNDAERLRVFRQSGIKGLISQGQYIDRRYEILKKLQEDGNDADPSYIKDYPWLSIYQSAGRNGLKNYLGTRNEIDFDEINSIISQFKNGSSQIFLRRMGREETDLWYDCIDFRGKNIIVIEWTHGSSHNLQGVDIPILLSSTPQETLEHRISRNRDKDINSMFTNMILEIEQDILISQASRTKLIISKNGEVIPYSDFVRIMLTETR